MENEPANLPTVAVLMATYNGARYLPEQLDSILAQEGVNVRIYIRDDGSTDNSVSIINEYSQRTDRVFLLDSLPAQVMVTKNFFSIVRDVDLSGIDYIAYCDQDDIWLSNKLAMATSAINDNKVHCYASNLLIGDDKARLVVKHGLFSKLTNGLLTYIFRYKSNKKLLYDYYFESASAGCTLVLGQPAAVYFQNRIREMYDSVPFDASHDWSTYAITRIGGFNWIIDKGAFIIYRQHGENAYGANVGVGGITKLIDLLRSGWYRRHILMIEELYNNGDVHPRFIETIRTYKYSSLISRFKVAFAISGHRRKLVHKIMLFFLIILGYFK